LKLAGAGVVVVVAPVVVVVVATAVVVQPGSDAAGKPSSTH